MTETSSSKPPSFPTPRETIQIQGDFFLAEAFTRYRGKTNGYFVERTSILSILDRSGRKIEGGWEEEWVEIAPGIETRSENLVEKYSIGDRSHELAKTASVRIHRHACPVHIQFRNTMSTTTTTITNSLPVKA